MFRKRKQLIIATAVVGLLAAAAPAMEAVAGGATSPFGQGNPLDYLQVQIDALNSQLRPPTPTNLTGDYATLGHLDCMFETTAFGSGLTVTPFAFTQSITVVGTIHYDGRGNATETARSLFVSNLTSQGASPVGTSSTSICPFTYAVNADGTFTQTRMDCILTNGDGTTTTLPANNFQMQGRIADGGKMLLIAVTTPTVETLINSGGSHQRVCTRSIVATKIN